MSVLLLMAITTFAQNTEADSSGVVRMFRDDQDNKWDVSNFLVHAHGFIPVPKIITEPALGSFGLALAPIFLQPNKTQVEGKYIPPTITSAFGGFSTNDSWVIGAFRIGFIPKHHLQYRYGFGYGDVNLDFYRETLFKGKQKYSFNFRTLMIYSTLLYEIRNSGLYTGINYSYMHNTLSHDFSNVNLPDFISFKDLKHTISTIGLVVKYDKRDNVFTPNRGFILNTNFNMNDSWTGSDYTFQSLENVFFYYIQPAIKWVSGFRFETQFHFGDAPFYLKPAIVLRGVPRVKYQGNESYVIETEQRYDIVPRWSIVGFGGLAKAPDKKESFTDAELVYNYGTGFRYLIARKFDLRTGIDIAASNDDFGWYIVFGSAWKTKN